jgi:hypothetical protein
MVLDRIRRWLRLKSTEPDFDTRIRINLETDQKNLEASERELAETECPERRVELLQLIESHKASIVWSENYLKERGLL